MYARCANSSLLSASRKVICLVAWKRCVESDTKRKVSLLVQNIGVD